MPRYHQTFQDILPVEEDFILHIYNSVIRIRKLNIDMIVQIQILDLPVIPIMAL